MLVLPSAWLAHINVSELQPGSAKALSGSIW
jgi:hypothetical protein